jgi:hypothetical protein
VLGGAATACASSDTAGAIHQDAAQAAMMGLEQGRTIMDRALLQGRTALVRIRNLLCVHVILDGYFLVK